MAEHPITPPPELVQQWIEFAGLVGINELQLMDLATQAARWGSDQELEACCEWLAIARNHSLSWEEATNYSANLLAARRSKPPTLKEQALQILDVTQKGWGLAEVDLDTIRRALEQLDD